MTAKSPRTLFFLLFLSFFGSTISTNATSGDKTDKAMEVEALVGNIEAGEARYNQTCKNCHGVAGKGVASYPKVSGNEIDYTTSKLETYREGIKIGPNSSLMIMMAKPLTDEEIANLAAYLKDAAAE